MRLPLQNLWGSDTLPADMPIALLPFSQYYIGFLAGIMIVGSAIAGVAVRAKRGAMLPALGGVLLVQVIALVQTAVVVSGGLAQRREALVYLAVIVGGIILAMLIGALVLVLIARSPRPGVLIAATITAIVLPSWLSGLFHPIGTVSTYSPYSVITGGIARYIPALGVGLVIAWVGFKSAGRIVAIVASLLLLWIGSTVALVGTVVAGTRVMLGRPAEMLEYAGQVFQTAIVSESTLLVVVATVAAAFIGMVASITVRRRRVLSTGT